ncbi:MAG: M16 family metallopeptidase [bacterium]
MRSILLLTFMLILAPSLSAEGKVSESMLDNGMKIIVKEDHRAPVVTSQVWYKVGSSYEHDGVTGISHVLEHMMFKGTKKLGPGEFSKVVSALGGNENAFTSRDFTAYFETLSSEHLEKALELEADRMQNLVLDEKEFLKEVEVVKEERRLRTVDKPHGMVREQFNAVSWRASTYRNPVIGWMEDLDQMTIADLEEWYKRWYAPNNATLVVVGDVKPGDVFRLAKKHFGPIPASELDLHKPSLEPRQVGLTRVEVEVPAKQPYLMMGFKTPTVGNSEEEWEPFALYMLSAILSGGDSARLERELVRKEKIAASVDSDYDVYTRLQGMMLFDGIPAPGHTVPELEQAIRAQIEQLKTALVSEEELKRVVAGNVSGKVYQQDSVFYQAMIIGILETVGQRWQLADLELDRIKAVTPEQVQAVARKYLVDENLTIAILKPQPMDSKKPRAKKAVGGRHG